MIRASFFYVANDEGRFDFTYYLGTHLPLAKRLLGEAGLRRLEVDRPLSGEERGSVPRATCVAHLYFDTPDAYYSAMDLHGEALGADVQNYTDLELEVLVSEVLP